MQWYVYRQYTKEDHTLKAIFADKQDAIDYVIGKTKGKFPDDRYIIKSAEQLKQEGVL